MVVADDNSPDVSPSTIYLNALMPAYDIKSRVSVALGP
jgi:hypothetical protein